MRIADLRFIFIMLAIVLAVSTATHTMAIASSKPKILKYARIFPEQHWIAKEVEIPWFNLVEKNTKGRIKISYYQKPVPIEKQLGALQTAKVDMGMIIPTYFPNRLPLTQASELPLIVDLSKFRNVSKAILETNEVKKEWEVGNNCKPLLMITSGGYHIWSKKPIKRPEYLSGMKIGVPQGVGIEVLNALGANPVVVPTSVAYAALQKGTVDADYHSTQISKEFRFYEVTKYGILFGAQRPQFWCAINMNSWKKLPEDIQKIILDTAQEVEGNLARFLIKAEDDYIKFLKQQNVRIRPLPSDTVNELIVKVTKQRVDDWIKKRGDAGLEVLYKVEMKAAWPCFLNPPACKAK